VGRVQERSEIVEGAIVGMNVGVIGDIVTVVTLRRGEEGQKLETRDSQIPKVIEFLGKAGEIADSVVIAVVKPPHMQFVDDGVFEP